MGGTDAGRKEIKREIQNNKEGPFEEAMKKRRKGQRNRGRRKN